MLRVRPLRDNTTLGANIQIPAWMVRVLTPTEIATYEEIKKTGKLTDDDGEPKVFFPTMIPTTVKIEDAELGLGSEMNITYLSPNPDIWTHRLPGLKPKKEESEKKQANKRARKGQEKGTGEPQLSDHRIYELTRMPFQCERATQASSSSEDKPLDMSKLRKDN